MDVYHSNGGLGMFKQVNPWETVEALTLSRDIFIVGHSAKRWTKSKVVHTCGHWYSKCPHCHAKKFCNSCKKCECGWTAPKWSLRKEASARVIEKFSWEPKDIKTTKIGTIEILGHRKGGKRK